jgi:hypothetical protein
MRYHLLLAASGLAFALAALLLAVLTRPKVHDLIAMPLPAALAAREREKRASAARPPSRLLAKVRGWVRWWLASPDWATSSPPGPSFSGPPPPPALQQSNPYPGAYPGACPGMQEHVGPPDTLDEAIWRAYLIAQLEERHDLARVLRAIDLLQLAGREGELVCFVEMMITEKKASQMPLPLEVN